MRLILCLFLIALAVPCSGQTGGKVCEAVLKESLTFVLNSKEALEKELSKYSAPPEAVQAKLTVKDCVDKKLNYAERTAVGFALAQVLVDCRGKGLLEKYFPALQLGRR